MIIDSSAIVAIIIAEAGHEELVTKLASAPLLAVGSPTLVESGLVLEGAFKLDGRAILERFMFDYDITLVPFTAEHWRESVTAFRRYGKGRHPAALNFGDCMTYATARLAGEPLLCVGDDFRKTDLVLA